MFFKMLAKAVRLISCLHPIALQKHEFFVAFSSGVKPQAMSPSQENFAIFLHHLAFIHKLCFYANYQKSSGFYTFETITNLHLL